MEMGIADLRFYYRFIKTISLKIPDELLARMDAVASAKRTSRSALLRDHRATVAKKFRGRVWR